MQKKRFNLPPLDLIQGFEAAARTLSFTKAAEELFITQSAVSRQIRGLEDHLGVALFERRRAQPCADGAGPHPAAGRHRVPRAAAGDDEPAAGGWRDAPPDRDDDGRLRFAVADPAPAHLHGAASRRRCAHLGQLQDGQPRAQPGRRGRALLPSRGSAGGRNPPVRRGAVPDLQPGAAERQRASHQDAERPCCITRCCISTRRAGRSIGTPGSRRRVMSASSPRRPSASTATSR